MKGKLIVIEAGDGSGKATQTEKLYQRLKKEGHTARKIEFPNYDSESSALIKMYLKGEFGSSPNDVNPYAASTFYAVDRFASYKTDWKEFYEKGGMVLADRYTTSNMIHQAVKIIDPGEKAKFLDWLWEFEFRKFELPVPDCVIFLDMPPEFTKRLMTDRVNKFTGEKEKDIHEKDENYLTNSYVNACSIADKYGWKKISCVSGDRIKTIDEIHEEVYKVVQFIILP